MKKYKYVTKLLALLIFLPVINLAGREGGHVQHSGTQPHQNQMMKSYDHHNNYERYQRYQNQNYGNYGGGGVVDGTYPVYPPDGSQPGMTDDSNALYQSQLRARGQGY